MGSWWCQCFGGSPSGRRAVELHRGGGLPFPDADGGGHLFMSLFAICVSSLVMHVLNLLFTFKLGLFSYC